MHEFILHCWSEKGEEWSREPTLLLPLQVFCYQVVNESWFWRCLLRSEKGVIKVLKGHLLQAKRALIRMELTPSYFSRFEFPLQYRGAKEDRMTKRQKVHNK